MFRRIIILFLVVIFIQGLQAQLSENLDIYVAGGITYPVESSIGKSFTFPQLNIYTESDFARDILNLDPDVENFKNFWKPGFNIGGGFIYRINSYLSGVADFNYNNFTLADNELQREIEVAFEDPDIIGVPFNENGLDILRGSIHLYQIMANIRIQYPGGMLQPYLMGGAGYLHVNQESIDITYYDEPFPFSQGNVSFYDQIPGQQEDVLLLSGTAGVMFRLMKNLRPFIQASYNLGMTENDNTTYYPVRFGLVFTL
ncbi:MAG: hypothetical protein EH225_00300 [Calditrichaeota bacterium]|nr:MAG: hypothetical protein EH225_00300 [Calditrichota bacterium]